MTLHTLLWIVVLIGALALTQLFVKPSTLRQVLELIIKTGIVIWSILAFRALDLHAQTRTSLTLCPKSVVSVGDKWRTVKTSTGTLCIVKDSAVPAPIPTPPPTPVPAPTPIPGGSTNEPVGMTKLTETGFNCVNGCGEWGWWDQLYPGSGTVVNDLTAPKSPGNIVAQNFTPSLTGGSSPGSFGTSLTQRQTIYVAIWMKLSPNFEGHPSGVNKVLHFFTAGGRNTVILNVRGSGAGTLVPGFLTQGLAASYQGQGTEVNFDAGASTCTIARGSWAKYELLMKNNTPGAPDGTLELWMNGAKCVTATGLTIVGAGQNNKWEDVWWSPTWGGVGSSPSQTFFEAVDHIYISGK